MQTRRITFCAVALLAAQALVSAQKTEIRVERGKIVAETANASVAVEAGRKVVLTPSAEPAISVDNPLVRDVMELHQLVEAEQQKSDLKIDSAFILVGSGDKDNILGALYFEFPNWRPEPTDVFTLPSASIIPDLQVYDSAGNLLQVDTTVRDETTASYTIHLKEPVPAGGTFRLIGVASLQDMPLIPGGAPAYYREGPVWYFRTINQMPNCLNYFRLILPPSAILLDTNRPVISTDNVDGRLAVTMRNYTGPYLDGTCIIAFLWPDQDGTSLADIPPEYHGLREARDRDMAATFQRELIRIEAGNRFHDQRTPLSTLLSIYSALDRQDVDDYRSLRYKPLSPEEEGPYIKQAAYTADQLTVLRIPPWPENPGDGYVHPVYLSRKGSLIHEFTQLSVYRDGGWYSYSTQWPGHKEPAEMEPGRIESAEAQGYLTDWEIVGPYVQRDKNAEQLFDIPFGPELSGVDVPWRSAKIEPYEEHPASVDISSELLPVDQSVAYLRTEIVSDTQKPVRLEIYADDGVKAWLNGEIILESNNSRGISEEPDAINVTLKQGVNQLMLKVTEDISGSRAIVRIGSDRAAGPRPVNKAICPETRVRLDWTPATRAQSHRVYFGDDSDGMPLLAEVSEARQLQPLSLEEDHRYYWRVDEVLADGSSIQGDVWSFTTGPQVAWWTFDGDARDQSVNAFNGTLHGNPRWVPGMSGQAVALEEDEDYVIIPPMNLNTDTITMTLWVRTEEIVDNPGLVFARAGTTTAGLWFNASNYLHYNWNDDRATWLWDSHLAAPNQTWTFAALVVDPERATIYMRDGTAMKSATHQHGHGVAKFDGVTYIGQDPRWRTLKGAIDDVRIFNRALDATEIAAIYRETAKRP